MTEEIQGKILFFDNEENYVTQLKEFFTQHRLIGFKVKNYDALLEVLRTNVDLGAVLLCEGPDPEGKTVTDTSPTIQRIRPELPIFLRRETASEQDDPEKVQSAITASYKSGDFHQLKSLIDTYLFNIYYPDSFIRGIENLTEESLNMILKNVEIFTCVPYLIKDSLIFGQLFSMIPLESSWCRGYMLLQTDKDRLVGLINDRRTPFPPDDTGPTALNSLLGEMTNMIWGRFKSHFFTHDQMENNGMQSQVPVIVDQESSYIFFGTDNPQLCFRYVVHDKEDNIAPVSIYQKFIFHLNWTPEKYQEPPQAMENLVEGGVLELF